jgi:hypothetical protein
LFFLTGEAPKDLELHCSQSGGGTNYRKGRSKTENYKLTLTICTKDPKKEIGKAIQSSSFSTTAKLAGDKTTWGMEVGANYDATREPPPEVD